MAVHGTSRWALRACGRRITGNESRMGSYTSYTSYEKNTGNADVLANREPNVLETTRALGSLVYRPSYAYMNPTAWFSVSA